MFTRPTMVTSPTTSQNTRRQLKLEILYENKFKAVQQKLPCVLCERSSANEFFSLFPLLPSSPQLPNSQLPSHLVCDPLPVHGEAALQQLHHELPDQLVRLVVGAEQQQRLLELLDVELEEVEGLPGDRTG